MLVTVYGGEEQAPGIYNFGDCLKEATAYFEREIKTWERLGDARYLKQARESLRTLRVTTSEQFATERKKYYLQKPAEEITEDAYEYALGALPPLKMTSKGFQMSEMLDGPFTYEFYKEGGRFFKHVVDTTDRNTWRIA